jgi:hypothetical protein
MARTSETFTQNEIDAFNRFCAKHNIINDGNDEASARFGDLIGSYIAVTWGQDLTDQTLEIALQKLQEAGHSIPFKSSARIEFDRVFSQCDPQLLKAFGSWFSRQTQLEDQGDHGFANAAAILSQLRGRPFSEKAAWDAVGRAQYSGKTLHFKRGPEVDRSVVNGRINHAAAKPSEGFMPKSEVRSSLDTSYEHNPLRHKSDRKTEPQPILDSTEARWKEMAQKLLRTGNSHSENDELQNAFNGHVGGSWRKTFEEMTAIKKDRMRRAAVGG